MKIKLLKKVTVAMLLTTSIAAHADDNHYVMNISLSDGTVDEYLVADHPTVKFDKDFVYVVSKNINAQYNTDKVVEYNFKKKETTSIEEIKESPKLNISIKYIDGKTVEIRSQKKLGNISVYSVDGRKQDVSVVNYDNGADVLLGNLFPATYIVKIGTEKSIKVIKR